MLTSENCIFSSGTLPGLPSLSLKMSRREFMNVLLLGQRITVLASVLMHPMYSNTLVAHIWLTALE